jgi:hypothetical protein
LEIKLVLPLKLILPLLETLGVNLDGKVIGGLEDTFYYEKATKKDENTQKEYEGFNLTNLKLSGAKDAFTTIKVYADALFPGLGFAEGTLGANFHYLFDSLGLGIEGLDDWLDKPYNDTVGLPDGSAPAEYASYVDYLVAYLGCYQEVVDDDGKTLHVDRLPEGFTDKLIALQDATLTIHVKTVYSLETVKASDGTEYQAIYCGPYQAKTTPWLIMTKYQDDFDADGEKEWHVKFNFEIMGYVIQF